VQLRINQSGEHPNVFIDFQGREIPFDAVEAGESQWNISEGWRLACTLGGSYVVENDSGNYHEFGPALNDQAHTLALQRIEDRNGNYIALRYDAQGKLHEMADCAGRLYHCEYDLQHPARLAAISVHVDEHSPVITLVRYTYDQAGRLHGVTNRGGETVRRFTWHNSGPGRNLMASHTLPTGLECFYEWADFSNHPRVVRHYTNDGESWNADYLLHSGEAGQTIVVDQQGRKQVWEWDAIGQITAYTDPLDRVTRMTWSKDGFPTTLTQPNGGVWKYDYDGRGNLIAETDPLGRTSKTKWRLDAPLPQVDEDAAGRKRLYEYDERHNLIAEDGTFGRIEIGRDRLGQPLSVTDPRGGVTHWTWHASGQAASYEDCSGRSTRYAYDAMGQISTETDAAGNTTSYRHDKAGRVDAMALPDKSVQQWNWQPGGMLHERIDALGQRTRFDWNRQGRLVIRTDATGHHVKYEYDTSGSLIALINENGQAYNFSRDAGGQLIEQTGLDGLRTAYRLNALGQPIEATQAVKTDQETTIKLDRDLLGRLLNKTTSATVTQYSYDTADQLTLIERFANADGKAGDAIDSIAFAYDERGNLIEETTTQYQANGKTLAKPRNRTLKHDYDVLSNRIATELPQQRTLNYLYYGSGHLHQINLDGEVISDIERDAVHREISRSQGALHSHYQRDALGRRTAQRAFYGTDSGIWRKASSTASFSAAGDTTMRRMARPQDGDVVLKGYCYDPAGELEQRIDPLQGERRYCGALRFHRIPSQIVIARFLPD
jgi:YD repeat-containing protein